jgi:LmbE family N-acetylglucosaminyl deacetylase
METMRTLIIAPHLDDETISCAGLIQARRREGIDVLVLVVFTRAYFHGQKDGWQQEYPDFLKAKKLLDFVEVSAGRPSTEGEPGKVGYYDLLRKIEWALKNFEPDEVIIPAGDDLNQDHRHLNHVCGIALRPINLGKIDRVLEFFALDGIVRQPSFYLPMTQEVMDKKIEAMACYTTESRTEGPRSPVNLIAQARVWGSQCGAEYAEAYHVKYLKEA